MIFSLFGCGNRDGGDSGSGNHSGGGLFGNKEQGGDGLVGTDATGVTIAEDANITELYYRFASTYIGGMFSYTFEKTDDGMQLSAVYDCINDDNPEIAIISKEDEDKLRDIITKYDVGSWDGYSKSATDVLDGSGFSFSVTFDDGTTCSASGNNCGPENYGEVCREIEDIAEPYLYDFLVANGVIYVEPVYDPIEYGVATSYFYMGEYVSRLRTCHLTKEDAAKYPEIAEGLAELNKYAQDNFSENMSEVVDIIRSDTNIFSALLYEYDPSKTDDEGYGVFGRIVKTINYKVEYGTKMTYQDLMRGPRDELFTSIRNEIHADYPEVTIEELDPYMTEWDEHTEDIKFTISPEWATVYFNPGEVADEKIGLIQAPVAYASKFYYASEVFKHPKNYVVQLCQPLCIYGYMMPDNRTTLKTITLNLRKDQGQNDMYYVCLEDGRVYLYTDSSFIAVQDFPDDGIMEGEHYRCMYAYDLDSADLNCINQYANSFSETDISLYDADGREGVGDGLMFRKCLSDPTNILLDGDDDYKDVLHEVGADGNLEEIN